ncbi:MAG TPA: aminomethyltransferase family protein [Candidatus Acidoferrales bacterium]|nr:aminomethyltransferase family protein [Candidatus Acidoferrales bacterium]
MPVGTAFHERTLALSESLDYRDWSGYFAAGSYETRPEHEYNAIRNAAAAIDVSPLYKYAVSGPDAARLIQRVIARDIAAVAVGQVIYCCWCDEQGKVLDDGTIARLGETTFRWTAAEPNLRWLRENAAGMDVAVEDVSSRVAALAIQGPLAGKVVQALAGAELARLRYYRIARARIGGIEVEISRTGYTGDLGYELWMPWEQALAVWDAAMDRGRACGLQAAGMLALDVARIEAGLLLIDVDYTSSRKALIDSQKYTPYEIGLGRLVDLKKENFVGRGALAEQAGRSDGRRLVGIEIDWEAVERLYEGYRLPPQAPATASRVPVPVYRGRGQAGRATSTTWSPVLKKMIALASVEAASAEKDTKLEIEFTVEAVRHRVGARVTALPFFHPRRKTATPVE